MRYFFVLGEHSGLSLAEIFSWLKKERIKFEVITAAKNILIIQTSSSLDASFLMRQLGGTIKIGVVEKKLEPRTLETWASEIAKLIMSKTREADKIYFGLSVYNLNGADRIKALALGLEIKKNLVAQGRKVRLVTSRQPVLSSVVVQTNKLLDENGLEIALMSDGETVWLGYTLVVQPFAELSWRDYGRPGRNALAGMLPPKLSKILLNLSGVSFEQALLDPFCGSGTILTEGWLAGYKNLFGSDNNDLALKNTQKNIEWLAKAKGLTAPPIQLKKCDARSLSICFAPRSIQAVVTEPWLGPPQTGRESPEKIKKIIVELTELYLAAFSQFKKILVKEGVVVMVLPVFRKKDGWQFLPILEKIISLGFKQEPLLPWAAARQTFLYARADQKVGRELVKFIVKD